MDEITTWNTGRKYRPEGQIIRAKVLEDRTVHFIDDSRGIGGIVSYLPHGIDVRDHVMREYDHGRYDMAPLTF
jgi:hypothetical protein